MRWTPLNMAGGFYSDDAKPWTAQDCCGFLPEPAEVGNTLSPLILRDLPGLRPLVDTGDGAIRGARVVEGKLFVVSGETLYQISNALIRIPIGRVPGVGAVEMSHNQNGGGNQLLIANGSAGYLYHTATGDFTRITDEGFPGAKSVDYLDSYFLLTEPAGRYWFNSDLASGTDYSTLDRYEAEYKPDRIVATRALYQDVVVFGAETTEFFYNSGGATGTFQNRQQSFDVGCASAASIVRLDNTLMWLDNKGVFQRLAANNATPVSNRVIERAVSGFNWSGCIGTTWEDKGRKVAIWSFPDGLTVRYDATTGLWHRSQSYGMTRWRINQIVFWNGMWVACDFQYGRLYELDWDYHLEFDQPKVRRVCGGPIHGNGSRVKVDALKVVADAGNDLTIPGTFPAQPTGPSITGDAPDSVDATAYSYNYTLSGGTAPYRLKVQSGSLPDGLSLSQSGALTGTPSRLGLFSFKIRNTDRNLLFADLSDSIVIGVMMLAATSSRFIPSKGRDWSLQGNLQGSDRSNLIGLDNKFVCYNTVELGYTSNYGQTVTLVSTSSQNLLPGGKYLDGQVIIPCYQDVNNGFYTSSDGMTWSLVSSAYAFGIAKSLGSFYTLNASKIWKSNTLGASWEEVGDHGLVTGSGIQIEGNEVEVRVAGTSGTGVMMKQYIGGQLKQMGLPGESDPSSIVTALYYCKRLATWLCGTSIGSLFYDKGNGWVRIGYVVPGRVSAIADNGAVTVVSGSQGTASGYSADGSISYSADLSQWTLAPLYSGSSINTLASLEVPES